MATLDLLEQALAEEGASGTFADLFRSIYQQESSSGKNATTSNAGAEGGAQILPSTFRSVADQGWSMANPLQNLRAGIRYLRQGYEASGGDPSLAAAYYYGGPGGMEKASRGIAVSDPRNPRAPTTIQYAQQVTSRMGKGGEEAGMDEYLKSIRKDAPERLTGDAKVDALLNWAQQRETKFTESLRAPTITSPAEEQVAAEEAPKERTFAQKAGRLGLTVGGGMLGTALGASAGVPGMAFGGGLGAAGGSLLAETFDPTESPAKEAAYEAGTSLVGLGVGKLFGKVFRPGPLREGGEELMRRAAQAGGRLPVPSQVFDSKTLDLLHNVGMSSFAGADALEQATKVGLTATREAAERYAATVARRGPLGGHLMDRVVNEANLQGMRVQVAPIRNAVDALANKYTTVPELRELSRRLGAIRTPTIPFNVADEELVILQGMARPGAQLNIMGAQNIASELKAAGRTAKEAVDARTLNTVIGTVEDEMARTLSANPQLARMWQTGRSLYRQGVQGEEMTRIINGAIQGGGDVGEISGKALMNRLKPNNLENLKTSLTDQQVSNLKRLARAMEAAEGPESKALTFVSNGVQISAIIKIAQQGAAVAGVAGAATGNLPVAAGAAALALTPSAIGKLLASERTMKLMLAMTRMPEGSKQAAMLGNQLVMQMLRESILTPDEAPQREQP